MINYVTFLVIKKWLYFPIKKWHFLWSKGILSKGIIVLNKNIIDFDNIKIIDFKKKINSRKQEKKGKKEPSPELYYSQFRGKNSNLYEVRKGQQIEEITYTWRDVDFVTYVADTTNNAPK